MKPDFSKMDSVELRTYIKQHRTDDDAIRELFVNRRSGPLGRTRQRYRLMKQQLGIPSHGLKKEPDDSRPHAPRGCRERPIPPTPARPH